MRVALLVSDLSLLLNVLPLVVLLLFQHRTVHRYFKQLWTMWQQHHPRRWSVHDLLRYPVPRVA